MFEDMEIVYWHWFAIAAALGTVEILAPGVFFLWLAIAALVTGLIVAVMPDIAASHQVMVFSVLSVISVYSGWKYIRKNPQTSPDPTLNLRSAQYVGKVYILESAIHGGSGRARIGDSSWRVEGPDMAAGSQVRVIGYDGATLKVEKVADPSGAPPTSPLHGSDPRIDPLQDSLKDPLDRQGG